MANNGKTNSRKDRIMKNIKLENSRVNLTVNDFIYIFSNEDENKDIITRIKDIAKNGVTINFNTTDTYAYNELLYKNKIEAVEKAYQVATNHGIKCRYKSSLKYFGGNTFYPVNKTIEASKKIDEWVEEIESARVNGYKLTPFEKFLYAYEIVTQYDYKDENKADNTGISRQLIHVLNGDRIVCAGYEAMFRHILNRVGIYCSRIYIDDLNKNPVHGASLVCLNDSKYNINGLFVSEPTWGNVKPEDEKGRDFTYSFLSISQAKALYSRNNLDLSEEALFDSKKDLFASVHPKDARKFAKMELKSRKKNFLENLKKYVVDDKKFFKRVTKEIKKIVQEVFKDARKEEEKRLERMGLEERKNSYPRATLKQGDISKDYKRKRFEYRKENLIEELVSSTTNQLDDYERCEKFTDSISVFDHNGKKIIKKLLETKHSVAEISQQYAKKFEEFIQKSDKEKLEKEFDSLKDITFVSKKEAERIMTMYNKVFRATKVGSLDKDFRGYYPKLAEGLLNVGFAKGMEKPEAKCYALARLHAWNDKQFKLAKSKVENSQALDRISLKDLNDQLYWSI